MAAVGHPSAVMVRPEVITGNRTTVATAVQQPCGLTEAAGAVREVDICGDVTTIEDANGIISDGVGPYIRYAST